jgi:hypothetical protein
MAVDPQVVVNIASEFTGKKAFKEAETATTKLSKGVKTLAKSLGLAFSVGAVVRFGKQSVKAFSDSQKEAKLLATQLNAVNLGFASPFIGQFIDKLALATGKAGGDLTNAFVSLSQATGDASTAQALLQTALDVSLGTGKDLQTVSNALARAYKGETTALAKLRIGFTTAELKGKKFDEVLNTLNNNFKGAAANAVDTYAGRMARLSEAVDMAKEKLGEGLVSGLDDASISIDDLQVKIINLGEALGKTAAGSVSFADKVISQFQRIQDSSAAQGLLNIFEALVRGVGFVVTGELVPTMDQASARLAGKEALKEQERGRARLRAAKALGKAEKDNAANKLKNEKKITDEKAIQAKLDKAALALGKGTDIFDLDKIQVQAALLAKQDEINRLGVNATDQQKLQLANDLTRLSIKKTMAELEDAIAAKDVEAATRLAKKLNIDLAILGALQGQEFKLQDINDILDKFKPKALIDIQNLNEALALLMKMAGLKISPIVTGAGAGTGGGAGGAGAGAGASGVGTGGAGSGGGLIVQNPFNPASAATTTSKIAEEIATLTGLRLATSTGTGINFLLKEQIDTLTDALTTNAINALGDEQARLRAMGAFDTPGIGPGSSFDPSRFRMGDNYITVNAGVVGSEDTIALAVQRAILDLERKGDPLRYTGGL